MAISSFLTLLVCVGQTLAHGFLHKVTIDGTTYIGNAPSANPKPSTIRQVGDVSAVKGVSNPDLFCGLSSQLAESIAEASPGSVFEFDWRGGDLSPWPHDTGPMLTYMTSCGNTPCHSTNAKWFKIDQVGQSGNGDWVQKSLMQGGVAKITIPSSLKAGLYLIRHEIIALHTAVTRGNAEFYPSCTQLRVTGMGTLVPSNNELVTFPGGYDDDDPGIYVPKIYESDLQYVFPGPAIAQLATRTGSNGTSASTTPSTTRSNALPTSPSVPSLTGGVVKCRLVSQKNKLVSRSIASSTRDIGNFHVHWVVRLLQNLGFHFTGLS